MATPQLARPVLANEDYELLQRAVTHYLGTAEVREGPESQKYSNLGYRLGSMARSDRRNAMVWE